jgi:pimeloyl-ACP methyl ester carboxylesterase
MKFILKTLKYLFIGIFSLLLIGIIAFWKNDIPLEDLKKKYTNTESKFVEIDGMNVHYRDEGNQNDSIPLVLIHGTGASLHTWEGWVNDLKTQRRIITLDLPAYGLTGANPTGDYSMEYYSQFIDKLLTKLAVNQCIMGGNSLGGGISWNYALAYPDKVKKLILVDAGGYQMKSKSVPIAFQIARMPYIKGLFKYVTPRSIVESSIKNVYIQDEKITEELIDRYFELSLREGNRQAFLDRMSAFSKNSKEVFENKSDKIKTIQVPTLILWGEGDGLIPTEVAQKFHEDLPNDTLVILKNLGHTPMEEDPKATVVVVKEFLKIDFEIVKK